MVFWTLKPWGPSCSETPVICLVCLSLRLAQYVCYLYVVYNEKFKSRKYNSDKFEKLSMLLPNTKNQNCINFSHDAMTL